MSTSNSFLALANEEHADGDSATLTAHNHVGKTVLLPTELRCPVKLDAESGKNLLPQNSNLKEADKDQYAKCSPLKLLSKSVSIMSTTLLSGDSVIPPQWGVVDTEIKVPSGENTGLKRSPFKAWSRSVYSHTCYTYCQGFLPCLFPLFQSIHLHFSKTSPNFFLHWLLLTHGSCVGPQHKTGHPAGCRFPC